MFLCCYGKRECFRILSCYVKSPHVVVKKQLESRHRQLGKTAVVKAGAYIVSIDTKTTVYGLEACESRFWKNVYVHP